jgi:hypothetical protein
MSAGLASDSAMLGASNIPRDAPFDPAPRPASLLRYSPAFFAFIVVVADAGRWADPDLWGHICFGRLILSLGHLPPRDIYSYSAFGHPWHDHEWLSEVIIALCYNAGGIVGLKLFKLACTAATVALLAMAAAETGASMGLQLAVLTTAAVALGPMVQFRPQLFDFIGLSALLLILARDSYRRAGPLWPAIPILALWANLHGGFFLGLAVLGAYVAVVAVEDWFGGDGVGRAIRVGLVLAACALATFANPYGIANWATVLHTLNYPLTRATISEWQGLLFRIGEEWRRSPATAINFALAIVPFLALAACFAARPRGGDLPLVAIAALMGVGAWVAVRNLALAVIAWVAPLCRHATLVLEDTRWGRAAAPARAGAPARAAHELLIGAIALLVALQTGLFSPTLRTGIAMPQGAAGFMRAHGLEGNVLCDFAWGEYLIFHMPPASRVFIDTRYDMVYPRKVIDDYLAFFMGGPRASRILSAYPHDFVLIAPGSPAYGLMTEQNGWRLIYRDSVAALFARSDSAAARLAGIPAAGSGRSGSFP